MKKSFTLILYAMLLNSTNFTQTINECQQLQTNCLIATTCCIGATCASLISATCLGLKIGTLETKLKALEKENLELQDQIPVNHIIMIERKDDTLYNRHTSCNETISKKMSL